MTARTHARRNTPPVPAAAPPIVHRALRSPGRPLDTEVRQTMESRFSHDFANVRVHTDDTAAASARTIGARAYAAGEHIAFASGRFAPTSGIGIRLLAHELAHVVQQRHGSGSDPERKAENTAEYVARGAPVTPEIVGGAAPGLHAQLDYEDPFKRKKRKSGVKFVPDGPFQIGAPAPASTLLAPPGDGGGFPSSEQFKEEFLKFPLPDAKYKREHEVSERTLKSLPLSNNPRGEAQFDEKRDLDDVKKKNYLNTGKPPLTAWNFVKDKAQDAAGDLLKKGLTRLWLAVAGEPKAEAGPGEPPLDKTSRKWKAFRDYVRQTVKLGFELP